MRFPISLAALVTAACIRPQSAPAPVPAPPAPTPGPMAARTTATSSDSLDLVIAATTDVHGRVRGWDYYENRPDPQRGLTRAASIVDSLREGAPGRVVLVDAGDLLQGNPLTYVAARVDTTAAHPVIAAMNIMRYDAAAIGNHEFNYGLPLLRRAIAQARFPLLAANAYTPDGRHAFAALAMTERRGVRIAIVGATTPGSNLWDHDNLAGRLTVGDIVPSVRSAVDSARRLGADVVIVLLHSGLDEPSSYDTVATGLPGENVAARVAHDVPGIDLIVYGHSHKQMADTTIGTSLLMQPKNWATSVAVAHLGLVRRGRAWHVARAVSTLVPAAGHAESPAVLAASAALHAAAVRWVATPVGTTPVAWRADSARVADAPLTDFVLEVERRAAHADLASTAVFDLGAHLDSGAVTVAELARLYPYDNTLKAVRITGRQLREYLEYSARYFGTYGTIEPPVNPTVPGYDFDIIAGAGYTIDLTRPVGERITRLEVRGRPVAATDTFTLALNNYRQSGGGGYAMLRGAPVVFDGQTEIRQLLIDEVRRRGRIAPEDYAERNWSVVPAPAVARAFVAMHGPPAVAAPAAGRTLPRLRIIATNDFHGALDPVVDGAGVKRGGAEAMAAQVTADRDACPAPCVTLLVDGGDLFQGSAASNLAYGRPVVALYNDLGYAATAVGNHEFDWGLDTLRARVKDARFPMLGANVRTADGQDVPWIPDDTLIARGELRIGLIGVIGPETYTSIMARNVAGLRFDDPAPIIDSLSRALRARGANAVIVLAHSGAFCDADGTTGCHGEILDMARRLTAPVDAIVSAHTHTLVNTTVNGIPIVQARSSGRAVAVLDLQQSPAGGAGDVIHAQVDDVVPGSRAVAPAVAALVARADSSVAPLVSRRVARLASPMPRDGDQYALGNLIADAQRWAGRADVAAVNNGGIRTALPAGSVTYGALFALQPFGNPLHRFTVLGAGLRLYFERLLGGDRPRDHVSGVTITYDSTRASGSRIVDVRMANGAPLRDALAYTIVLNEYMATGYAGRELARGATADETLAEDDLTALVAYLQSRPQPVAAPAAARIIQLHP